MFSSFMKLPLRTKINYGRKLKRHLNAFSANFKRKVYNLHKLLPNGNVMIPFNCQKKKKINAKATKTCQTTSFET